MAATRRQAKGTSKPAPTTSSAQKAIAVTEAAKKKQRKATAPARKNVPNHQPEPDAAPSSNTPPPPSFESGIDAQTVTVQTTNPEAHGPQEDGGEVVTSPPVVPLTRLEEVLAQLEAEKVARQRAEDRASQANSRLTQMASNRDASQHATATNRSDNGLNLPLIPKPKANKMHIQQDMGLKDERDTYVAIRQFVTRQFNKATPDLTLSWAEQPMDLKGKVAQFARSQYPILGRCTGDWATNAIIQQFLSNHRKHLRSKEKRKKDGSRNVDNDGEHFGTDEELLGGANGVN